MNLLVISTSLNQSSRSRTLAAEARDRLADRDLEPAWLDLADLSLPYCDGDASYGHDDAKRLGAAIDHADGIIVGLGIYNYGGSPGARSILEFGSKAWSEKVTGFVVAAGGQGSFMSVMAYANSLMLDFRTVIVPRFVYATDAAFDDASQIVDDSVHERIDCLVDDLVRFTAALRVRPEA